MDTQDIDIQLHLEASVSDSTDENPSEQSSDSAQRSFFQLSAACYFAAEKITQRVSDKLPGLSDLFSDRVVLVVGGKRSGALGHFAPEKWAYNEQAFDEIHVNIGHDLYVGSSAREIAVDMTDTICHELAHLYARANGISDTSGPRNSYHNKKFAGLAERFCLHVVRSGRSHIGFQTVGLTERGHAMYADVIDRLEHELRLLPNHVAPAQSPPTESVTDVEIQKYVFAQCGCEVKSGRKRTLRMARGSWLLGPIRCSACSQVFVESLPERTKTAA